MGHKALSDSARKSMIDTITSGESKLAGILISAGWYKEVAGTRRYHQATFLPGPHQLELSPGHLASRAHGARLASLSPLALGSSGHMSLYLLP